MMIARSTAAQCPLTTTCPGALSFATAHTSARSAGPSDASAATSRACSTSRPSSAAIAPSPTGIACCIAWPRSLRRWAPSPTESACAAAKAEYSPSECPATKVTFRVRLRRPSVSRTRMTARLAAINAGWAFSVRVSSFSGPSNIKCDRFCASASSTSANSRRADPNAAARAPPMPTACEPCPGNTNARFIRTTSPHFVTDLAPAAADDVVIAVSPLVSRRRCDAHLVPRLAPQYMKYGTPLPAEAGSIRPAPTLRVITSLKGYRPYAAVRKRLYRAPRYFQRAGGYARRFIHSARRRQRRRGHETRILGAPQSGIPNAEKPQGALRVAQFVCVSDCCSRARANDAH